MRFPSTFRRKYTHRAAAVPKLCFSSAAANHCVSLSEDDLIQPHNSTPSSTARELSGRLSEGKHSDVLSLLRRTPPSRYLVFYWNNLIKRSVALQDNRDVLHLFDEMRRLQWSPDSHTYPYVLKACGEVSSLATGKSVHALALVSGYTDCNVFVDNAAIAMYGRCSDYNSAHHMFDEMLERGIFDTISWNSIISMYVQIGDSRKALRLFKSMVSRCDIALRADAGSLVNVLPACASLRSFRTGEEIHGYAVRRGLIHDVFVGNAVMDMYAKCGLMDNAKKLFDRMEVKDVVTWNALVTGYSQIGRFDDALGLFDRMREKNIELNVVTWSAVIAGYAQRGLGYEALDVFKQMVVAKSQPNAVTLVSVLSGSAASGALDQGKETHCYAIKQVLNLEGNDKGDDMMVINGLIDMYAKCKNLKIAQDIFDTIEGKDKSVVTWTALIGGYAQHGEASEALGLFTQMVSDGCSMMPNGFTISSALVACARVGALRLGREIHAYALRNRYDEAMVFIANCLIDMYAKSGDVDAARTVFNVMSDKNAVSWTSMMTGYGMHGRGEEAVEIFEKMRAHGVRIDGVTFVVLLYSCSHSGIVEEGIRYFENMKDYGVVPESEHYACMVDLLGRAGRLNEAMEVIEAMPVRSNPVVWVSLLSACRLHWNVEIGEHAVGKLLELRFENDGLYTLMSNIYANARQWKDVARVRVLMKRSGIRKRPGCSWVQGNNSTASFYVGDKSHPMAREIYDLLYDLIDRAKAMGYIPETGFALHDVDDEEKGDLLLEHSEKLALAYGILTTPRGRAIRIIKNLRVCGDCHTAIGYISRMVDHEIILRDTSRFHHFKNGSCSCKGYW